MWKKDDYAIVEVKADQKLEKKLATAELETTVDPAAEWRQIFADAWRFERDYFYDPEPARRGLGRACARATASCSTTR